MAATISALPTAPSRSDSPSTFSSRADAWIAALPTFVSEANTLASEAETDATNADASATASAASAAASAASAVESANSAALASFAGNWSALTGAVTVPTTVRHEGNYWALLSDLADVTASEPGVTADWSAVAVEMATDFAAKTTTVTAAVGKRYLVNTTSAGVTVNLPAGSQGARVGIVDYAGTAAVNNITVAASGSEKILGSTDDLVIDVARASVELVYVDATQGWILI